MLQSQVFEHAAYITELKICFQLLPPPTEVIEMEHRAKQKSNGASVFCFLRDM